MTPPSPRAETKFDRLIAIMQAAIILLATASYLIMVADVYSWWIVLLISPLALCGAGVVFGLLAFATEGYALRAFWIVLGICLILNAGHFSTVAVALAFVLIGCLPRETQLATTGPITKETSVES